MIVIIAGMPRSGSTFSFNIVRELLKKRGGVDSVTTNSLADAFNMAGKNTHLIIKTHGPDESINQLIKYGSFPAICTIRKPEDAAASWMRAFGFDILESINTIEQWLRWHKDMSGFVMNVDYKFIDRWPLYTVYRMARYVVQDVKLNEVIKIWWKYRKKRVFNKTNNMIKSAEKTEDAGFTYYDKDTFFHRRHVSFVKSETAKNSLFAQDLQQVRDKLHAYIDSEGNYVYSDSDEK